MDFCKKITEASMRYLKRLRTFIGYAVIAIQLLLTQNVWATPDASNFPKLTGHVVDTARVLDAQTRQQIADFLTALEQATSDQIVVATIPSLGGETVEEYATALLRHWGLGQKDKDNGVLLLFAMNDHKIRIEVGYGLEGELTDAKAKLIVDDILTPAFKAKNYGVGIKLATQEIANILGSAQQYALFSQVPEDMTFPDYKNYFTDEINLFEPAETARINQFLGNLDAAKNTKIAIISQGSIGRLNPIAYTSALFKHWQLRDSDMLIVISRLDVVDRPKDDENLKHLIGVKVGKKLQKLIPIDRRYKIIDSLKSASRGGDLTFDIESIVQESADTIDKQQGYEHLLQPTDVLPALIAAGVLSVIFLLAVIKVPTGKLRLICIVLFIASVLALLSYAYSYLDSEPDYLEDALPLHFFFLFFFCLLGSGVITWISLAVIGMFSTVFSKSSSGGSYDDDDDSTYFSSSSSGYSGGGGSSGGGGASGSW